MHSFPPPPIPRTAAWLNGLTWALLALLRRGGYDPLGALLLTLPVAGLGAGINLFLFLWYSLQGQAQQARLYLLGFLLLLLGLAAQVSFLP